MIFVSAPIAGGRKHPGVGNAMINTKNILFICGGAFEGLKVLEEENKKQIGFGSNTVSESSRPKGSSKEYHRICLCAMA